MEISQRTIIIILTKLFCKTQSSGLFLDGHREKQFGRLEANQNLPAGFQHKLTSVTERDLAG